MAPHLLPCSGAQQHTFLGKTSKNECAESAYVMASGEYVAKLPAATKMLPDANNHKSAFANHLRDGEPPEIATQW